MRTTHKAFTSQIQEHILNNLSEDYTTNPQEQLQNLSDSFKNWYGPYEQRQTPNKQEAFISFLNGLPSELHVEFTNHGINETLKTWFENTGTPYKEQDSDKESELYRNLIYRELRNLCKQNNVNL